MSGLDFVRLCRRVEAELEQEHRYAHVVRVARLADRLAQRHGEDPARARLAGMLHDLARLYAANRLLEECRARSMQLDAFELSHPIVLHARLGAELARERFGVEDEGVLDAIRAHTLGSALMSELDEVLFLADALEPGRDFPGRADLERLAFADLEAAMSATLRSTFVYLTERGLTIAPSTLAAAQIYDALEEEKKTA